MSKKSDETPLETTKRPTGNHHMRAVCPKCGGIMDNRATVCQKCHNNSGDSRRGTGRGYYYSNGYKRIHRPLHPNADRDGYILEHRLIMEEYLHCYLEREWDIHHLNQIRDDNRLENLELFTSSADHHKKYHGDNQYVKRI